MITCRTQTINVNIYICMYANYYMYVSGIWVKVHKWLSANHDRLCAAEYQLIETSRFVSLVASCATSRGF